MNTDRLLTEEGLDVPAPARPNAEPTPGGCSRFDPLIRSILDAESPTADGRCAGYSGRFEYSLEMPSKMSECHIARNSLYRFVSALEVRQTVRDDIRLAVGEAISNAVRHGAAAGGSIVIDCCVDGGLMTVSLRYPSARFDPEEVPAPDPTQPAEGGMGIYLMRLFMDSVEYTFRDGCAVLTLTKFIGED